jgi:hypothetical protein
MMDCVEVCTCVSLYVACHCLAPVIIIVRKPNFDVPTSAPSSHNRSVSMSGAPSKTAAAASTPSHSTPNTTTGSGDHRRTSSMAPASGAVTPPLSSTTPTGSVHHANDNGGAGATAAEKPDSLAVKLPALSHRAFMSLISRINTLLLHAIQRTVTHLMLFADGHVTSYD